MLKIHQRFDPTVVVCIHHNTHKKLDLFQIHQKSKTVVSIALCQHIHRNLIVASIKPSASHSCHKRTATLITKLMHHEWAKEDNWLQIYINLLIRLRMSKKYASK